jgi:hypothetical protein
MVAVRARNGAVKARAATERPRPDLEEWLNDGRLTLVHPDRGPIPADSWGDLPAAMRANALREFDEVVRSNSKAAVLFLRS